MAESASDAVDVGREPDYDPRALVSHSAWTRLAPSSTWTTRPRTSGTGSQKGPQRSSEREGPAEVERLSMGHEDHHKDHEWEEQEREAA
jgi:hypothetical protein